jgi:prepilin-type N-terminal cleavage/methylation domain-containing protein
MEFRSKPIVILPARQKGVTLLEVLFALAILGGLLTIASLIYSGYRTKTSETVAQEDLRQAYTSAMTFFVDFPERTLTRADLEKYGFHGSPRIETRIVDGRLASLLLVSYSRLSDSKIFMVQGLGTGFTGTKDSSGPTSGPGAPGGGLSSPGPSGGNPGNSFAGPVIQPINEAGRSRCSDRAKSELQEAFAVAQKYFAKEPGGSITKDILMEYGFEPSEEINLLVLNGTRPGLELSATFSVPGALNFRIDSSGSIRQG